MKSISNGEHIFEKIFPFSLSKLQTFTILITFAPTLLNV